MMMMMMMIYVFYYYYYYYYYPLILVFLVNLFVKEHLFLFNYLFILKINFNPLNLLRLHP